MNTETPEPAPAPVPVPAPTVLLLLSPKETAQKILGMHPFPKADRAVISCASVCALGNRRPLRPNSVFVNRVRVSLAAAGFTCFSHGEDLLIVRARITGTEPRILTASGGALLNAPDEPEDITPYTDAVFAVMDGTLPFIPV